MKLVLAYNLSLYLNYCNMSSPNTDPGVTAALSLNIEDYATPMDAFNTVAGAVLTEAARRGIVDFSVNDLQMIDAIDALNTVATYAETNADEDLDKRMAFVKTAYETDGVHDQFSFGIEARLENDVVNIWWPQ